MTAQLITPDPNIACTPGYCLQYVRQAFGLPARYGSATEAWDNSTSQHRDRNYPAGVWLPVWYGVDREPAGHVVLLAPDGSVYSTSDNTNTPHHHPTLTDLEDYYAGWGWPLTYRGWTEDVAGYPVISAADSAINVQSTPTTTPIEEIDMAAADTIIDKVYEFTTTLFKQYHEASIAKIYSFTTTLFKQYHEAGINENRQLIRDAFTAYAAANPGPVDPEQLALAVAKKFDAILAAGISTVDVPATVQVEALDVPAAVASNG